MPRSARWLTHAAASAIFAAAAVDASAQASSIVLAARHSGVTVDPGATATLVYTARNDTGHPVGVTPSLSLPRDWQAVTGSAPFTVAARSSDVWVIGVAIPRGTVAGAYRVVVALDGIETADTATITVRERVALDLRLVERPTHVLGGERYQARFLVVNRGNSPATVVLVARSSEGTAQLEVPTITLAPAASQMVTVNVATRGRTGDVTDDILEMDAVHAADSSARAAASGRVLLIPRPSRWNNYHTVAARVSLRAAGRGTGVAPYEVSGGGLLRAGGDEHVSFLVRGKPKGFSVFGDRDEYTLDLRAPNYRLRLGDNLFMLSPLTTSGHIGSGASIEARRGILSAGAHSQRFRFAPTDGAERAGYVAVEAPSGRRARLALNLVDRRGGDFAGRVGTVHASARPTSATVLDVEYAASDAQDGRAYAHSARASGSWTRASLDFGRYRAGAAFAGPQRGSEHDYANASVQVLPSLRLNAFGSRSASAVPAYDTSGRAHGTSAGLSATVRDRVTVEASTIATPIAPGSSDVNTQKAVRVRSAFALGAVTIDANVRRGFATDVLTETRSSFTEFSVMPRLVLGRQQVGAQFGMSDALTSVGGGTMTAGADAALTLGASTRVSVTALGTRATTPGARWMTHVDARVEYQTASGVMLAARARTATSAYSTLGTNAFYVEMTVPLRLPTMPLRVPGRVVGRVVDAESRRGVGGALVRLGEKAAVTDSRGNVTFSNVQAGQYRVTLADPNLAAGVVLLGNHTIAIDSARRSPTRFAVEVTNGATVRGDVRRLAMVRKAIDQANTDSLVDGGAIENVVVALQGARDTLYQTTGRDGRIEFTDVAPGRWTLLVIAGDVPPQHAFDRERVELALEPGEQATARFRLVPRRRAVQMITSAAETVGVGGGTTLATRPK